MNIAVIGLGLMGGSAAKALKAFTDHRVLGMDCDPAVTETVLQAGAIDAVLQQDAIKDCDLFFLAMYPQAAISWMEQNAPGLKPGALVVDFCGVKERVVREIAPIAKRYGIWYVGGHPMAGIEKSGFSGSKAEMFQRASMILTPDEDFPEAQLRVLEELFRQMGFGYVTISTPQRHDRIIAYTSQLAHVLSSAYVQSPIALQHDGYSAGSLRDMTRVAWLNEYMWAELFMENSDYLAEETEQLVQRLMEYTDLLRKKDRQGMEALLRRGRIQKEQMIQKELEHANHSHSNEKTV